MEGYAVQFLAETSDTGEGMRIRRLPAAMLPALSDLGRRMASAPAGVEIRGVVGKRGARVELATEDGADLAPTTLAEVYHGDYAASYTQTPWAGRDGRIEIVIPPAAPAEAAPAGATSPRGGNRFSPTITRVILPYDRPVVVKSVEGFERPPEASDLPSRRLLVYGSSISQGGSAVRPSGTYAMLLASRLGCDLVNLSLAGSCQLEPGIAVHVASRTDWQVGLFELGINLVDKISPDELGERTVAFMEPIVRSAAVRDAVVILTDIFPSRAEADTRSRIPEYRRAVADAAAGLSAALGVSPARFRYRSAGSLPVAHDAISADRIHPSPAGMEDLARGVESWFSTEQEHSHAAPK